MRTLHGVARDEAARGAAVLVCVEIAADLDEVTGALPSGSSCWSSVSGV
ncbi:hypothetical protein [Streptomyces telluris]|uniref:Uncharacterized protein n=1 Tax=Streptomyces telluris TaxID=2720021 RepID=A0A9X2LHL0_9ACTN|nr:hypothetical protein [Streptomyces telluris]MCQ8771385.1 hypothetical protein [Streptomyces telluris]NJP82003.1 hypothetical protein [Streptomyces telluris]